MPGFYDVEGKAGKLPPPPGLDYWADFAARPGANGSAAAYYTPGDSPSADDDWFVERDATYAVAWNDPMPPADHNPQAWWDDRNVKHKHDRTFVEHQHVPQFPVDSDRMSTQVGPDPNWVPAPESRPTFYQSPTTWSFSRPFDQEQAREFSGLTGSLATLRQAYQLEGTVGMTVPWNNTYRSEPLNNDSDAVFLGDTVREGDGARVRVDPTTEVRDPFSFTF